MDELFEDEREFDGDTLDNARVGEGDTNRPDTLGTVGGDILDESSLWHPEVEPFAAQAGFSFGGGVLIELCRVMLLLLTFFEFGVLTVETVGKHQVADFDTRVDEGKRTDEFAAVVFVGNDYLIPPADFEEVFGKVGAVCAALLDAKHTVGGRVDVTRGGGAGIPVAYHLGVGVGLVNHPVEIVRIVEDAEVAAGAENTGFDGAGDTIATLVVFEFAFLILDLGESEAGGPAVLVPLGFDEGSAKTGMTQGEVFAEGGAEEFFVRAG